MHHTGLRRVGGSIMLTVPPAMLAALGWAPGANVGLRVEGDRLVVERTRPRYTLDQLLAEREAIPPPPDDAEWLSSLPVGREEI
jgi:antitoxin ChpS